MTVNCNNGDGNIVSEIPVEIILDNTITQAENILTANAIGATYQWLDCNNNNQPIENQTNQVFTATENGSYAVEISNGNCVIVSNCVTVSNLSVENIQKSVTMKVYPNPVNDNVNIKFDKNFETLSLEIISITGQVVKKSIITQSNLITINISDLAKGIYILKADDNEHITSTRIIKE